MAAAGRATTRRTNFPPWRVSVLPIGRNRVGLMVDIIRAGYIVAELHQGGDG